MACAIPGLMEMEHVDAIILGRSKKALLFAMSASGDFTPLIAASSAPVGQATPALVTENAPTVSLGLAFAPVTEDTLRRIAQLVAHCGMEPFVAGTEIARFLGSALAKQVLS